MGIAAGIILGETWLEAGMLDARAYGVGVQLDRTFQSRKPI